MSQEQSIDYKAVLADLENRRSQLDQAIAAIRLILGEESGEPPPGILPDKAAHEAPRQVKSDTFFNLSATEAAKKYLTMSKGPRSTQEITDALKAGGYHSMAKNLYSNVFTALKRGEDTFIKVKRGQWGLVDWYPGRSRAKGSKENEKVSSQEIEAKSEETTHSKG